MQPKVEKEKTQEMMNRSDQMEEKKVVLEFLKEEKPESKTHTKMSSTVNNYGRSMMTNSLAPKDSRGMMRGQSLNYNKRNASNVLMENGNRNTKYQQESIRS